MVAIFLSPAHTGTSPDRSVRTEGVIFSFGISNNQHPIKKLYNGLKDFSDNGSGFLSVKEKESDSELESRERENPGNPSGKYFQP